MQSGLPIIENRFSGRFLLEPKRTKLGRQSYRFVCSDSITDTLTIKQTAIPMRAIQVVAKKPVQPLFRFAAPGAVHDWKHLPIAYQYAELVFSKKWVDQKKRWIPAKQKRPVILWYFSGQDNPFLLTGRDHLPDPALLTQVVTLCELFIAPKQR
ncbi:MAG: hypothetical protein VKJ04_00260 [Vampirovibrionales bacterium]|nr:hypothetical protein [Vampirovibrionales bacterium]